MIGSPTLAPVKLISGVSRGVGAELEVRVIDGAANAMLITTEGRILSDTSVKGLGGGTTPITSTLLQAPGQDATQLNRVVFSSLVVVGGTYTITLNGTATALTVGRTDTGYSITRSGQAAVSHTDASDLMSVLLQEIAKAIEATHSGVAVTVDAAGSALLLQARAANTAFDLSAVTVTRPFVTTLPDTVANDGRTPLVAAGDDAAQRNSVVFASSQAVAAGLRYSIMVNGHDYAVQVGENATLWVVNGAPVTGTDVLQWTAATNLNTNSANLSGVTGNLGSASFVAPVADVVTSTAVTYAHDGTAALVIDLAGLGTPVVGTRYAVVIGGKVFETQASNNSAADLAGAIGLAIESDADFAASTSGTIISVLLQDGTTPPAAGTVASIRATVPGGH
ncbi:MAG: hypothetical protein U1E02_38350, partial [Hydrogenophaga sp.]|nr:hypothetical protein [Hydrogenophaga sp.]